jgi:hypothetical protein
MYVPSWKRVNYTKKLAVYLYWENNEHKHWELRWDINYISSSLLCSSIYIDNIIFHNNNVYIYSDNYVKIL